MKRPDRACGSPLLWMSLASALIAAAIAAAPQVQAIYGWLAVSGVTLVSLTCVWGSARLLHRKYSERDEIIARRLTYAGSAVALVSALSVFFASVGLSSAPALSAHSVSKQARQHELIVLSGLADKWEYPFTLSDKSEPIPVLLGAWSVVGTSKSASRYEIQASFRHPLLCERSLPFFPQAHLKAVRGTSWPSGEVPRTDADIERACSGRSLTFAYDTRWRK